MSHFDVFNGDADGLCALQQLRLAQPRDAVLVTGMKRDIALLQRVTAEPGDTATVLDVSLHRNREALLMLLERGVFVQYFDHHFAGEVPSHPLLEAHLDPAPGTCTSLLVDRHLDGAHRAWAVVGAFGDNMADAARPLALAMGLDAAQVERLRVLGEAMNYNAYGDSEAELLVPPARLAMLMRPHADPLAFMREEPLAHALAQRQQEDLEQAFQRAASQAVGGAKVHVLPDEPWARRVQGAFAHALAVRAPEQAHVVLRESGTRGFVVSVRAPQHCPQGAETLCLAYPGGGGRAAAAGIDLLPRERLSEFIAAVAQAFPH
jgi:hypothetical protein